jgi:hypothetical protein
MCTPCNKAYSKYIVFGANRTQRPSIPLCCADAPPSAPVQPFSEAGAVPESVRLQSRACPTYIRTGPSSNPCVSSPGQTTLVASSLPVPMPVRSMAASERTELLRTQTVQAATDPTNPATRFEQFQRPQPPAPPCPERLPNLDPITPDRPCVGFSRFAGSQQQQ